METIDVALKGISNIPGDYACEDGEIAYSTELCAKEDGVGVQSGYSNVSGNISNVVYVHKAEGVDQYIVYRGGALLRDTGSSSQQLISSITNPEITHVGNTLIVSSGTNMWYFLFRGGGYTILGNQLPSLDRIRFGLVGYRINKTLLADKFDTKYDKVLNAGGTYEYLQEQRSILTEKFMGGVNKAIKEEGVDNNRFIFPFFIRCALRLYDGSLAMHTIPIYMNIATGKAVQLLTTLEKYGDTYSARYFSQTRVGFIAHKLVYSTASLELDGWSDIVQGIEVFASAPIYTHDQDGEIRSVTHISESTFENSYSYCKIDGEYYKYNAACTRGESTGVFTIGKRTADDVKRIRDSEGTFFLLTKLGLEKTDGGLHDLPIEAGTLETLVNKEAMTDDYRSNDKWIGERLMTYNSRLHLGGVKYELWKGQHPFTAFQYIDYKASANVGTVDIYVKIQEAGKTIIRYCGALTSQYVPQNVPFLFYPNVNAKEFIIKYGSSVSYRKYPLRRHPVLNGAYATDIDLLSGVTQSTPSESTDKIVSYPNQMAASEVNNPFLFKPGNVRSFADGDILSINSPSRALSQGQFGRFMYAFTTAGVYAMEIKENGDLGVPSFLSLDVPANVKAIGAIEGALVYPTKEGIKMLSGSETISISDAIGGLENIEKGEGIFPHSGKVITSNVADNYIEQLSRSYSAYDSKNQRIIFFHDEDEQHLVYYIKSKRWGVTSAFLSKPLKSILPYALNESGKVVDFSAINTSNAQGGGLVTRPIKLGSDAIKKVRSIEVLGKYTEINALILWGSRNLKNWFVVGASRTSKIRNILGSGYKYYRVGISYTAKPDDVISGIRFVIDRNVKG